MHLSCVVTTASVAPAPQCLLLHVIPLTMLNYALWSFHPCARCCTLYPSLLRACCYDATRRIDHGETMVGEGRLHTKCKSQKRLRSCSSSKRCLSVDARNNNNPEVNASAPLRYATEGCASQRRRVNEAGLTTQCAARRATSE
jgi:hypothetical protein